MTFLIIAMSVWRLASLFSREDGPYRVFERIRHFIGVRDDGRGNYHGENQLAEGLLCMWCCSVWFSTLLCVYALAVGIIQALDFPLYVLATSAAAIVCDEMIAWLEHQQ